MKNSKLVYSTDKGRQKCPKCGQYDCICETPAKVPLTGQTAKILIDRKGRKGKGMTVIEGLRVNPAHLADIARKLKQQLGVGGTAKNGRIEIQGEHRDKIAAILGEMGVKSKFSGG